MIQLDRNPIVYQDEGDPDIIWIERKRKTNLAALAMGLKNRKLKLINGKVFFIANIYSVWNYQELQNADTKLWESLNEKITDFS